ncbi:MAG TPA: hypothetical protein VMY39_01985 [Planctomycetota bacterium]|nr:hypothetical protein [Planctomycetota bacterium]HUV38348.1 hypothetical protein [Planctomycetota bacterium]
MRKWILAALAVAALGFVGGELVGTAWAQDDVKAADATKVLFDFEDDQDVTKWEANKSEISASTEHATSGKQSLKVVLNAEKFPGLRTQKFERDWSGYATLKFDVFTDAPLNLMMTVKDKKSKDYASRYNNERIKLKEGANTVSIPLEDVGAKIDLKAVLSVTLFGGKMEKVTVIYLDNVRLEK